MDSSGEKPHQTEKGQFTDSQDSTTSIDDPNMDNPRVELEQKLTSQEQTADLKDPSTVSGSIPKKPSTVSGNVPEEPSTVSVNIPEEPSTVSGNVPEEPSTVSGNVPEEPSTVSGNIPKEPFTVSGSIPKEPSTVSSDVPKEVSIDTHQMSLNVPKDELMGERVTIGSPIAMAGTTKELVQRDAANAAHVPQESQPEPIQFQGTRDSPEKGITKARRPTDLSLFSSTKYEGFQMSTFQCEDTLIARSTYSSVPETVVATPHKPNLNLSETQLDDEALRKHRMVEVIKEEISANQSLMSQVKEGLELLKILFNEGAAVLDDMDGDLFFSCKELVAYVNSHAKKVDSIAKTMGIEVVDPSSPPPVPWEGINTLIHLIFDLSYEAPFTVLPEEVIDTVNANVLMDAYWKFLKNWDSISECIDKITEEMLMYLRLAETTQKCCNKFTPTITIADPLTVETIAEGQDMFNWQLIMAKDCYYYLEMINRETFIAVTFLQKYFDENERLQQEMNTFLSLKLNLFGRA